MRKCFLSILTLGILHGVPAQEEVELPPDLRTHNLLNVAPGIFNPVFSLDQRSAHNASLWSRWQWQSIDADPTSIVLNYSRRTGDYAFGAAFFQNNTRLYQQTGGILNGAYEFSVGGRSRIRVGSNIFFYNREIADDRLFPQEPILPFSEARSEFILQWAPALEWQYEQLGISISSDNLLDFNFRRQEALTRAGEKTFTGMVHYSFPVASGSGEPQFLRPMLYIRDIAGFETQVGLTALWNAPVYWIQGGYNSFYGPSLGAGGRFFGRLLLGAVMEFGSSNTPQGDGTSYELMVSYDFGSTDRRKKVVGFDIDEDLKREAALAESRRLEAEAARRDSLTRVREREELALQQERDSLRAAGEAAELAENRRLRDSLQTVREAQRTLEEEVAPREGERYQEVEGEEGLEPGFYLIANVFGTQKYYEAFMKKLTDQGLEPKSFYRSANKFNYVYLGRYNSISEARAARDSKLGGNYDGDLWIFRVR